jgi:hypothetical protein
MQYVSQMLAFFLMICFKQQQSKVEGGQRRNQKKVNTAQRDRKSTERGSDKKANPKRSTAHLRFYVSWKSAGSQLYRKTGHTTTTRANDAYSNDAIKSLCSNSRVLCWSMDFERSTRLSPIECSIACVHGRVLFLTIRVC